MYKKILVGLDGSKHGLAAADQASQLAAAIGAELHLLTITRPYKVTPQLKRYLEAENLLGEPKYVMDEMTNQIVNEAKELAIKNGAKDVKTVVREGKIARGIIDYAKANGIDMIVVGSRGVGEVEAALLGSVSGKVSMLAECTVVIVRT